MRTFNMDNVCFRYGVVLGSVEEMPPNSIALDGYVAGPQVDAENRRFSFDHHANCLRLVTLSTCEQVMIALALGLVVSPATLIYVNDHDADSVLAAWLLLDAREGGTAYQETRVKILVRAVGLVDSHGPVFRIDPLHRTVGSAPWDKNQSKERLIEFIQRVERWYATKEAPTAEPERPSSGFGLRATGGWVPVESADGFGALYAAGYLAAALHTPAPNGTTSWTIGKRSDLVPLALGPAEAVRGSGEFLPTVLGKLAAAECEKGCPVAETWGGASSIGGSPRRPDKSGSTLTTEEVLDVLQTFRIG